MEKDQGKSNLKPIFLKKRTEMRENNTTMFGKVRKALGNVSALTSEKLVFQSSDFSSFVVFTHFCFVCLFVFSFFLSFFFLLLLFFCSNEFQIQFSQVFFHHMRKSTSDR